MGLPQQEPEERAPVDNSAADACGSCSPRGLGYTLVPAYPTTPGCMTRADEISEIGKQYETKPGFYGDTANLSRGFCCPAIFTLCVNPQSVGERLK